MKYILFFLLIIGSDLSFGQEDLQLKDYTPQSPTAYQLNKFANTDVNESTGLVNLNIPLFSYSVGGINISPSLGYTTSGIKVNQIASWVGMGWNLNFGGTITRETRGVPDDEANSRVFTDYGTVMTMKSNNIQGFVDFAKDVVSEAYDYEPDIFSFTVQGYSGSFYLDQNFSPVIINHDKELKITTSGNTLNSFEIITPSGITYIFGGLDIGGNEAIEYSKSDVYAGGPHTNPDAYTKTAWHLTEIKGVNGEEIYLRYDNFQNYSYVSGFEQEWVRIKYSKYACSGPSEGLNYYSYRSWLKTRKVSEISNNRNDYIIEFNISTARPDLPGEIRLESINLKEKSANKIIKGFNFNYNLISSNKDYAGAADVPWLNAPSHFKRVFLDNIEVLDNDGNFQIGEGEKISFRYKDPSDLPPRMSFSQDLIGYYNGHVNYSFLPEKVDYANAFNGTNRGNRNADFTEAEKGMLYEVLYPTGGKVSYEFEPAIRLISESSKEYSTFDMSKTYEGEQDQFSQTFTAIYSESVIVNPRVTIINGEDYVHDIVRFVISDNTTSSIILDETVNYQNTTDFNLPIIAGHEYSVLMDFSYIKFDVVKGKISFDYQTGELNTISPNELAGFRVKSTTEKKNNTHVGEITNYFYNSIDDIDDQYSSLETRNVFNFIEFENELEGPNCGESSFENWNVYDRYVFKSSGLTTDMIKVTDVVRYDKVTKVLSNGSETGYIEKQFEIFPSVPSNAIVFGDYIYSDTRETGIENGRLLKETIFDNNKKKIKQKRITYIEKDNLSSYIDAFLGKQLGNNYRYTSGSFEEIKNLDLGTYKIESKWTAVDSVIITEYFPNNIEVKNVTKNFYETGLAGMPTKIISTGSKHNIISKNHYAIDENRTLLINSDRIGEIVKSESFIDSNDDGIAQSSELLSQINRKYSNFNTPFVKLSYVQAKKGSSALEDRIIYSKYDDYGNPVELQQVNGASVVYLWSYNGQYPVAKIENAELSEVASALGVSQSYLLDYPSSAVADLQEDSFRTSLPNSLITTYTYEPLVGMTSMTDPGGRKTTYDYDDFGRLESTRDADNYLLEEYKYHYRNQ